MINKNLEQPPGLLELLRSFLHDKFAGSGRLVVISYESKDLRSLCEQSELAEKKWGKLVAQQLLRRIADIRAATTSLDVVAGQKRFVGTGPDQHMVLQLAGGYCLVVAPNPRSHIAPGHLGDQAWGRIARVKIARVEVCDV